MNKKDMSVSQLDLPFGLGDTALADKLYGAPSTENVAQLNKAREDFYSQCTCASAFPEEN